MSHDKSAKLNRITHLTVSRTGFRVETIHTAFLIYLIIVI